MTNNEARCVTRFKVGDRVRNVHASYLPVATVTEITERGFRYELERPLIISPRLGTQVGGESFTDEQWELANDVSPVTQSARERARSFEDWFSREDYGDREQLERYWAAALSATPSDPASLHWPFAAKHDNCVECDKEYEPVPKQDALSDAPSVAGGEPAERSPVDEDWPKGIPEA